MKFLALAAALALPVLAITPITVKGAKLFKDQQQWFMKGVAYQGTPDDPLVNGAQCALDAALMKSIGVNSIRVYHVDPTANHDSCMQTFADAGIYPWIDLDTFTSYILLATATWTQTQYDAYAKVMDAFAKYDNVAGFFVGNEMVDSPQTSFAVPYIKAAARDMKAYRDSKSYRKFPIGYTAADIAELRPMLQNYLACGNDTADSIDVYGLNAYEWCGNVNYMTSGYAGLQSQAASYNIPIFFSETGCNVPMPRDFADQSAILGPEMLNTWSGAIIYEWIQETNKYGLVTYPSGISGTPTPIQPDFSNLSKQWATLNPTGISKDAYTPSLSPPACPAMTPGAWSVQPDAALPTIGAGYSGSAATTTQSSGTGSTMQSSGTGSTAQTSGMGSTTSTTATGSVTPAAGALADGQATSATTTTSRAAATQLAAAAGAALAFVPFMAIF